MEYQKTINLLENQAQHAWQNARINTVRCAMCIFLSLKFYNFIKGIMRIHIVFLIKPKTDVFIIHLLTCSNIYNL